MAELAEQLQQLVHLQKLKLYAMDSFPPSIACVPSLQDLSLEYNDVNLRSNFSDATQLTKLSITWVDNSEDTRHVMLPCGQHVQLACLKLSVALCDPLCVDFLDKLGAASGLHDLGLHSVWPPDMEHAAWPRLMPHSTSVVATPMPCGLPVQWRAYTALQKLELNAIHCSTLPTWVSELSNLKQVMLARAFFTEFPVSVLCLSQLISLNLSWIEPPLEIPQAISSLAGWSFLTDVNFALDGEDDYSIDSQMNLMRLQRALGPRRTCVWPTILL